MVLDKKNNNKPVIENTNKELLDKCYRLAERLYDLDAAAYKSVGSSLGRIFSNDKESSVKNMVKLMTDPRKKHLFRSEMALVSNIARTIPDKETHRIMMTEYDSIVHELADVFEELGSADIVNIDRVPLNSSNLRMKFLPDDHLIICISRTQGSAGNDIGFALADHLQINYYDEEIFNQVLRRLDAENDNVSDLSSMKKNVDKYSNRPKRSPKEIWKEFNRYHGLPKQDAIFFNMSDLICQMCKEEDCIIMGRCADIILTNHHIPHVSIFINAPFDQRVERIMETQNMTKRQAIKFLKKMDKRHEQYYNFHGNGKWGHSETYDLCVNSASYGIDETVEVISRMLQQD